MAKLIPLPRYDELPEVVVFHRTHPTEQRITLQVPIGPESSETYVIRMDQQSAPSGEYDPRTDHNGWLKRLNNYQGLMDALALEAHVAYYPHRNGTVMPLEDPDTIPWMRKVVALARREGHSPFDKYFRKRSKRGRLMSVPPLRSALQKRPGGAPW